eukprot:21216-Chlamydomonas_euryale.AAC.13
MLTAEHRNSETGQEQAKRKEVCEVFRRPAGPPCRAVGGRAHARRCSHERRDNDRPSCRLERDMRGASGAERPESFLATFERRWSIACAESTPPTLRSGTHTIGYSAGRSPSCRQTAVANQPVPSAFLACFRAAEAPAHASCARTPPAAAASERQPQRARR